MVSWNGAGQFAAYDATTRALKKGRYSFATAGSVDTNAGTRLQYGLPTKYKSSPMGLFMTAPFAFTSADASANPNRGLAAAAYIVPASAFPAGSVPAPADIYRVAQSTKNWVISESNSYVTGGAASTTFTFNDDWNYLQSRLSPNTKYWVLIIPVATVVSSKYVAPTPQNQPLMKGAPPINTIGRALSFWTNRTPAKPVITLPISGTSHSPGEQFDLTYTTGDADTITPADANGVNADRAGVQVQYAALPTRDVPNPEWQTMRLMMDPYGNGSYARLVEFLMDNPAETPGQPSTKVIEQAKMTITGGLASEELLPDGTAYLPGGTWQLRVRTADYGHPYPLLTRDPGGKANIYSFSDYPSSNVSPWSDPVTVTVTSQVPPPVLLSPVREQAVEITDNKDFGLAWQYLNSFVPPKPQARYVVQARAVGDTTWSTLDVKRSAASSLVVKRITKQPVFAPISKKYDFEDGLKTNWGVRLDASSAGSTSTVVSGNDAAGGTKYLRFAVPAGTEQLESGANRGVTAGLNHPLTDDFTDTFSVTFKIRQLSTRTDWDPGSGGGYALSATHYLYFLDSAGNPIADSAGQKYIFGQTTVFTPGDTSWRKVVLTDVIRNRPVNAAFLGFQCVVEGVKGTDTTYDVYSVNFDVDDFEITAGANYQPNDMTFQPGTEYEWRVMTTDNSNVSSSFSPSARFWGVPEAGSGGVVAISDDTIEGATLGVGHHTVEIYRRGGLTKVATLNRVTSVKWGRLRDEISEAQVSVSGWSESDAAMLAGLKTWGHEVVIWRDNGYDVDRVWEGPITLLTYRDDEIEINAKDVMGYGARRIIKAAFDDSKNSDTVVSRATRIIQSAYAPDDPNVLAYLTPIVSGDDANEYRNVPAYARLVYEEVDDMAANSGLDYTCVGRSILLWGTKRRIGTLPEFRDENLGASPIVSEYGMSASNRYAVSDGNGIYGEATRLSVEPERGLIEMLSSSWASDSDDDSGTYTQAGREKMAESFRGYSEKSIASRWPPPVVVRVPDNTSLNPNTVVSIQNLVPGVVIPLRSTSTLRKVVGNQKLDSVSVTETEGKETITIVLSPFNGEDIDLEGTDEG